MPPDLLQRHALHVINPIEHLATLTWPTGPLNTVGAVSQPCVQQDTA